MKIFKRIGRFFLDILEAGVMALAIFVLVYLFLFQPHQVRGSSMYPTFEDKQYILTDKISYRFHEPQRGEVIIFKSPQNPDYEYIKRIIGIPGDTVEIKNGKIFINELVLPEEYLPAKFFTYPGRFSQSSEPLFVPEEQYFVLGDNRGHSSDSREWGLVPQENIVGKAWFRYWPPGEIGLIKEANYESFAGF